MKEFFKTAGLLLTCIFLARFIMPANYTPLIAMAVFMPFVDTYKEGLTPNPCVLCNRNIKLGALLDFTKDIKYTDQNFKIKIR